MPCQDTITPETLKALDVKLLGGKAVHVAGTDNLEAYIKLLQGQEIFMQQTSQSHVQARRLLEEVNPGRPEFRDGSLLFWRR